MNGQFLTVKKEEGLSPVKHGEFVPAKKLENNCFCTTL